MQYIGVFPERQVKNEKMALHINRIKYYYQNTMQKSKLSVSQSKLKPKLPLPTSNSNKSLSKVKDKTQRVSPRANRMHTLQTKKSIQIPKKTKQGMAMSPALQQKNINSGQQGKGYETPKFKWELQATHSPKKHIVAHNYFSFGQMEEPKEPVKPPVQKNKEAERSSVSRLREGRPLRKQNILR